MDTTCDVCKKIYKNQRTLQAHKKRCHLTVPESPGSSAVNLNPSVAMDSVLAVREVEILDKMLEYQRIFDEKLTTGKIVKSRLGDKPINPASLPKDLRIALELFEFYESDMCVCESL